MVQSIRARGRANFAMAMVKRSAQTAQSTKDIGSMANNTAKASLLIQMETSTVANGAMGHLMAKENWCKSANITRQPVAARPSKASNIGPTGQSTRASLNTVKSQDAVTYNGKIRAPTPANGTTAKRLVTAFKPSQMVKYTRGCSTTTDFMDWVN